jgi:uracil-DNA glycosylase
MAIRGFFSTTELKTLKKDEEPLVPKCSLCRLYEGCKSPKMPATGRGSRKVLIVAEAPGATEDDRNEQLVGESGQLLRRILRKMNVNLDDCLKTNAIICRPPNNDTPTELQIEYCRPNLTRVIEEFQPETIITLGIVPLRSLLIGSWREDIGSMTRWAGWQIPSQAFNAWICPTYHPSYLLRALKDKEQGRRPIVDPEQLELWFKRHLEAAFGLEGRPWQTVPDYMSKIEVVQEPAKAAAILDEMVKRGGPFAFDYETNMLKPDSAKARIVCCSVSWRGKRTIAYPWSGPAIEATRRLLLTPDAKYGSNIKFEERWTEREFGHGVNGWAYDTMVGSHVMDNRRGITSIKFQAFVRLGQGIYDEHIKPYLISDGSNVENRIMELDPRDLLLYNGLDSLLEYKVAEIEMKEIGLMEAVA